MPFKVMPMSLVPTKFHCPSALLVVAGKSTLRRNFFPSIQMDKELRVKTFLFLHAVFVKLHEQVRRKSNIIILTDKKEQKIITSRRKKEKNIQKKTKQE